MLNTPYFYFILPTICFCSAFFFQEAFSIFSFTYSVTEFRLNRNKISMPKPKKHYLFVRSLLKIILIFPTITKSLRETIHIDCTFCYMLVIPSNHNSIADVTIKQVFFIAVLGTQGIGPPNVCTFQVNFTVHMLAILAIHIYLYNFWEFFYISHHLILHVHSVYLSPWWSLKTPADFFTSSALPPCELWPYFLVLLTKPADQILKVQHCLEHP